MQGWESVCWGVLGIPLLEKHFRVSWFSLFRFWFLVLWMTVVWLCDLLFYGFTVLWFCGLWFYGLMVLWFHGVIVLWLYGCMISWFYSFIVLWLYGFLVSKMCQVSIPCFQEDIGPVSKFFKILLEGSSSFSGARLFGTCQFSDCLILRRDQKSRNHRNEAFLVLP